ncbi:hypothetical protein MJO29_000343, partial [Puccinia striiformis f. sp. tritici]
FYGRAVLCTRARVDRPDRTTVIVCWLGVAGIDGREQPRRIKNKKMNPVKTDGEELHSETEELSPIVTTLDISAGTAALPLLPPALPPPPQHHQHQHHYQPVNKQPQAGWKSDTRNFRIQGWDPILIISQILAIQALHYLILSIITPPMLRIFAKPGPLEYEGGAFNVAMIIDWRAMSGSSTLHLPTTHLQKTDTWNGFGKLPESLGRKTTPRIGTGSHSAYLDFDPTRDNLDHRNRSSIPSSHLDLIILTADQLGPDWISQNQLLHSSAFSPDSSRAWVISIAWLISSLIGVIILYEIVRRPKQIMDHSLTTSLNHLILTTYYSSHLPSSIWFYFVLLSSSVLQILITEHICVKREFRDGLGVGWKVDHRPDDS